MSKKALTDRGLRAMKAAPAGTREMVWDTNLPGFGVRVTDKGSATFLVMRRIRGQATPKRFPGGFAGSSLPATP